MAEGLGDEGRSTPCVSEPCPICELCGAFEDLKICAGCRETWYCSKEHQNTHWSQHKHQCKLIKLRKAGQATNTTGTTPTCKQSPDPQAGSKIGDTSERKSESLSEGARAASGTSHASRPRVNSDDSATAVRQVEKGVLGACGDLEPRGAVGWEDPIAGGGTSSHFSDNSSTSSTNEQMAPNTEEQRQRRNPAVEKSHMANKPKGMTKRSGKKRAKRVDGPAATSLTMAMPETKADSTTTNLANYVVDCLTKYGICVVDKFLGETKGNTVHDEVLSIHRAGEFQDGQLLNRLGNIKTIRGDKIAWVQKGEPNRDNISFLIDRLDTLVMACNSRLPRNEIGGRTKAMVACYPGNGSFYLRHVDNPNADGRLLTCIYYLNKEWDSQKHGGTLRIFPVSTKNSWVADIDPLFDRLLFFWSDRRNPHEVQAAHKERFAITVWYFDKAERERAVSRYQGMEENQENAKTMSSPLGGDSGAAGQSR